MRPVFALLVAGLAAPAWADDPKPKADPPAQPKKPEATLKVGDKAPPLKADKWLQGEEVKGFEAGKVYVVEFWQTWCGPCIVMMPHLADVAEEYKSKGVTVIGYAGVMGGDTPAKVAEFVKKRGPKLGYTFANSGDGATTSLWMTAAGQSGIPCSFVVDQKGAIAYIGHPMYLDAVLPKVVAGNWDATAGAAAVAAFQKDYMAANQACNDPDPAAGVKKLTAVLAERPEVGNIPYLFAARLRLLAKAEKYDELEALAGSAVDKSTKRGDTAALGTVASVLAGVKGRPALVELGLKAADANLTTAGETDVNALMTARSAYAAAGQTDKAKAFSDKALALAEKELKGDDLNGLMRLVSLCRTAGETEKAKTYTARAVGAAEKAVKGDDDWQGNLRVASVAKQAGLDDKAKVAAQKAYDSAPEQMKPRLVPVVKQYGVEVKKDDK